MLSFALMSGYFRFYDLKGHLFFTWPILDLLTSSIPSFPNSSRILYLWAKIDPKATLLKGFSRVLLLEEDPSTKV